MEKSNYFKSPTQDDSLEEKNALIKSNLLAAKEVERKIDDLKHTVSSVEVKPQFVVPRLEIKKEEAIISHNILELFHAILSINIDSMSDEEATLKFRDIIKGQALGYQGIIDRLKLLLYKELLDYSKLRFSCQSEREKEEVFLLMATIERKIEILDDLEMEEDIEEFCEKEFKLLFLTSKNGNVVPYESLRKMAPEYYYKFKLLLSLLKRGKFKRLKRFISVDFFELRFQDVRLFFDFLNNDTIIVIDGVVKKIYNSNNYDHSLTHRNNQYMVVKDKYLSLVDNEDFLAQHDKYLEDIFALLEKRENCYGGGVDPNVRRNNSRA